MWVRSMLIVAGCLGSSGVVHAQVQDLYAGGFFSAATYKEDGFGSVNPMLLGFKVGSELNPNIAVEARLGFGVADDSLTIQGLPVSFEIDNFIGAYLKGIVPLAPQVSAYGLVGYTRGEASASVFGFTASSSDSDVSFGLGLDVKLDNKLSIGIEWARLFGGPGYTVDGITAGLTFKF